MAIPSTTPAAPVASRSRMPELADAVNLRDLGGYPTLDGRTIRRGRLYRSTTAHGMSAADLERLLRHPDAAPEDSRAMMLSLYRDLPYDCRDFYREIFAQLARGDLPMVLNCTAGKDWTGVAVSLVLTALQVPREIIMDDYRLTGQFHDRCCELPPTEVASKYLHGLDRRLWEPLMRADPAYLDGMFDQLVSAHGSAEAYLRQELEVTGAMMARIRTNLLD